MLGESNSNGMWKSNKTIHQPMSLATMSAVRIYPGWMKTLDAFTVMCSWNFPFSEIPKDA